jgi:azurin/DNA-binding transcriptional ArsR family regulator
MCERTRLLLVIGVAAGAVLLECRRPEAQTQAGQEPAPRILLDVSPRAVEYQVNRLSNSELVRVERKPDDVRYRPVYFALLTRRALGREYFDEALAALVKMDRSTHVRVLLDALPKIRADDGESADRVLQILFGQPADALRKDRAAFARAIESPGSPLVLRGAYGAMMLADGGPEAAWQAAAGREGHLAELLRSVPHLPSGGTAQELRRTLFDPIAALLAETQDPAIRVAALSSLGWTRPDTATFRLLAREVLQSGAGADSRDAAVRSLQLVPRESWPPDEIEPLARAIVALVKDARTDLRTSPPILEAIQLGEKLAEALPPETGRAIRRDLRALGVQVVRIEAVPEQMIFDLKWFVVEAGKPVQIVLYNPDAMSHNLIVGKPGSLQPIGIAAGTMTLTTDTAVKPYVPDSPLVLHATRLLNWGETERLNFVAPREPGEYVYLCSFPGHWVRMYGVMLVVQDLEAWEAKRTIPTDPMTNRPFVSQRN